MDLFSQISTKTRFLIAAPILATMLVAAAAFAQNPAADSNEVVVPFTEFALGCRALWFEPLVINDQEAFQKALGKERSADCDRSRDLKIDFQKYTLIALTKSADCNAMISVRVTKNTEKKLYTVTVEEKYGGCRGMTPHNRSFLVEKLPADYSVQFKELKRGH